MNNKILRNGIEIPPIIFGPDAIGYTPHPKLIKNFFQKVIRKIKRKIIDEYLYTNSITNAFLNGFLSVDFSAAYGNGQLIAKAIKKSGISRERLFLTTRVSNKAQYSGIKAIEEEFKQQLLGFNIDYFDMLMFHWPVTNFFEKTWEVMLKLREQGFCRTLGVANCHEHHLEQLFKISGEYPLVNQVEIHPLFTQLPLRKFCKNHEIQIEAYSPTARQDDRLLNPPLLRDLAVKYNKSKTQLILRWHIQNDIIPIIRTLNSKHQKSDIDIFDFEISKEDMDKIDSMNINSRIRYDPDNCDFHAL